MDVLVRGARKNDLLHIARNLRFADQVELDALLAHEGRARFDYHGQLLRSFDASCWADVGVDTRTERPFIVWGVAPLRETWGCCWMVATPEIGNHKRWLLETTPRVIERMHTRYRGLWNWCDENNHRTIRWLEWAGFQFTENTPVGGEHFVEFIRCVQ